MDSESFKHYLSKQKTYLRKLGHVFQKRFISFSGFLDRIKRFPWFSLLLLGLLGWSGYQVTTSPHSPAAISYQQSIHFIKNRMQVMLAKKAQQKKLDEQKIKIAEKEELTPLLEAKAIETVRNTDSQASSEVLLSTDHQAGQQELDHLKEQVQDIQHQLAGLQTENSLLRKELSSLQAQIENVQQLLRVQAQQLSRRNEDQKKTTSVNAEENLKVQATPKPVYSVYAVVQGRAWLNMPNGKMMTVREGSVLQELGVVQSIDTENGLVYFNQGTVIGPSEHDN